MPYEPRDEKNLAAWLPKRQNSASGEWFCPWTKTKTKASGP
jgi:hypothetical protein